MPGVVGVAVADPLGAEFAGGGGGGGRGTGRDKKGEEGGKRAARLGGAHRGCLLDSVERDYLDPEQRKEFKISSSWSMYSYFSRLGA